MSVHAFWGVTLNSDQPIRISSEIYDIHITQAALSGTRAPGDIVVAELTWNANLSTQGVEQSSVVLCSLYPGKIDQAVLNVWLATRQEYLLTATGRTSVSLLGYYSAPNAPGSQPGSGLRLPRVLATASEAAPEPVKQHNKHKRPRMDDDGNDASHSASASTSMASAPVNPPTGGKANVLAQPAASLLGSTARAIPDRASGSAGSARPTAALPNRDNIGPSSTRERSDIPNRRDVGPSTSMSSNNMREQGHPSHMTQGQKLNPASSAPQMEPLNVASGAGDGLKFGDVVVLLLRITIQDSNVVVVDRRTNPMTVLMGREHILPYIQHQLVGMKQGQHAVFVTPPRLAYGASPRKVAGNVVPPNSTLVWDITISAINPPEALVGFDGGV